jgi:hypothetical protein
MTTRQLQLFPRDIVSAVDQLQQMLTDADASPSLQLEVLLIAVLCHLPSLTDAIYRYLYHVTSDETKSTVEQKGHLLKG